jgi:NAD(P)-dependent dehydrogenase (short-subunit alcohol dehydrogenase family)
VQNGAKCWVSSRDAARFEELKKLVPNQFHSQLAFYKADLMNENECLKLKDEILNKEGKINHVISSIGGWRTDGKLSSVSSSDFVKILTENTLPHVNCYRTFSKVLSEQPKSTYTFISGGSGEAKFFDPRASLLPPSAGAVYGLYTSAISEYKNHKNLALNELRLFFWIRRQMDSKFDPKKSQMEVGHDYVGKFIPKLILKHKSDVYKIQTRSIGDQLYEKL